MKGTDFHKVPFVYFQNDSNSKNYQMELKNSLLNQTPTVGKNVSNVFFSSKNIDIINKAIILTVYDFTNQEFKIPPQSNNDLMIVMSFVYDNYAENLPYDITKQVRKLNDQVVKNVVPGIITNLQQYIGYLKDASQLPTPIALPVNVNDMGKTLPSVTNIYK
ncbi:hypothetical protein CPAV1605_583 [seawater metagenome]|uniref:Minor capsid protein P8 central region domain-containing protein n=1 Tax=seawater metagenome TaxID=1561972 RepID=A0A5E8CHH4_9ZZZZ